MLGAVALVLTVWLGSSSYGSSTSVQQARTTAEVLAAPLVSVCDSVPAAAAEAGTSACDTARRVLAADPAAAPPPRDGVDGRGIRSTEVRPADGHLVVTYDDGTHTDVGQVVGPGGVGLAAAVVTDGRLVLTWTDGRTQDLGRIVGENGRGIATVGQVDGRLIITYDDGTSSDAGPLPRGAPGPTCPDGQTAVATGQVTASDGTTYSRSTTCVDPTSAVTE